MAKPLGDHRTHAVPITPSRSGVASPLVDRESELRRIIAALTLASEGQGGTIFLVGQPGIGKTRLAKESLALAKGRGFTALEGRTFPMDGSLAYAPFLDAFGPLLRSLDSIRLAVLVEGLTDLGRLFGVLRLPLPSFPSEGSGDSALDKTRLFETVSRLLERLTQEAPVLLVMDDVHLADPASLDMLHYLARGLLDKRALLIATYSEDAMDTSPGLRSLVVSLKRGGLAKEIVVTRLHPDAVDMLARGILGGKAPAGLIALLHTRAGENPLFVEALIAGLIDSGDLVRSPHAKDGWILNAEALAIPPPSVRHLILDRLARLAPADRCVLDLVAVVGEATSHTILRSASGLREKTLLKALRRLRAAGLVAEGLDRSDVVYSITHPLIQEVAYAELPEMERRRVHVAAINVIESFSEKRPDTLFRLARHYQGAGDEVQNDRALATLLAAGERAYALFANEEATRHYVAALSLVRQGCCTSGPAGPSLTDEALLPWLLERLGELWERIGEGDAAIQAWSEALAERVRAGPSQGRIAISRLRSQLALAEWDRGHFDIANVHLMAGLVILKEGLTAREPCQQLADLLFARCRILSRLGDVVGVADTAAELLSVVVRLASPRAEAEANWVASVSCAEQNDITGAREHAQRALTVSEHANERAICCRAHDLLACIGMCLGDHQVMRYHAERGLAVAQHLGAVDVEIFLRIRLTRAHFMAGGWDESRCFSAEAVSLARRVGHPRNLAYSLAERAMVLAFRGDLFEAESCISEARMAIGGGKLVDRTVFSHIDLAEMAIVLERGQAERALGIARGFFRPSASAPSPAVITPAYIPIGLMLLAEAQVAAGDGESALETSRNLIGLGPAGTPYLTALASRAEGLARQSLGQEEAALDCLARAHSSFTVLTMPFEAARSLLEQAEVRCQGIGHRGWETEDGRLTHNPRSLSPAQAAQQSLATFERLGASRYAERARRLLQGLGTSTLITSRPRLGEIYLTERELEVALLVAQGLTTADIAKRLTITRFTVNSHLQHVYARLGINSRTALALLVIEAGLPSS
ncbi:MAG: AAA family ATPase [Dehalococcoidia bacterium]|nr:AAA family ATPase [Dehalococcoidia bacterium]